MEHTLDPLLVTSVSAILLGMLAQIVAHRFKLPAILPLLILGMAAGPFGIGLVNPSVFGHGLEVIIHLGVAVILFEGGLILDPKQLREVGGSLRNLLSIGTAITWVGAAAAARYFIDVDWSTAALFGAIVTVTGPTVIAPLLRHMVAPKSVRTLLLSEGLMIDAIGAVLAYLVLQWIERAGLEISQLALELGGLLIWGTLLGYVGGQAAIQAVKRRFLGEELRNLAILSILVGVFAVAEWQAPQSGILASVIMGLTVSTAHLPDLSPLKAFKGQLTVLVISVLFVLLSAQLDLNAVRDLGLAGALVVAALILVIRPLSVFLSIPPSKLGWKERLVLALTAPRGIVAAAVASLSAIALRAEGLTADATALEGLVYLVILVTCTWATIMAAVLPRALGYLDDPSRRRTVLIGANGVSRALAQLFTERGWYTVIVDSAAQKLRRLRQDGLVAVSGDARDASTYEDAGVERDTRVLALTYNDELNLLVAELVRDEFGVEHPVVVQQQQFSEFGSLRQAWVDLLGNRDIDIPRWARRLDDDEAHLVTLRQLEDPAARLSLLGVLREHPKDLVVLCGWRDDNPIFEWEADEIANLPEVSLLVRESLREEISRFEVDSAPPEDVERPDPQADPVASGAPLPVTSS